MAKSKRDPKSVELANRIIEQYQPESVQDMQNALKDIFGPMFESMLKGEMNHHLGYNSNDKGEKSTENRRNGYGKKTLNTSAGEVEIEVPRDRNGSFEPKIIPKRKKRCFGNGKQGDCHVCEGNVPTRHFLYNRGHLRLFCVPRNGI